MKKLIPIILLAMLVAFAYADYKAPVAYKVTADRVATNVEEAVELQARMIDGKPNPEFTKRRNASARIWSKDKDDWEVIWRRVGVPASEIIVATGTSVCKALERQPVYIRVRLEVASLNEPTDPALEVGP